MVTCDRCGWSFDSIRMSRGGSCPRCRLRDGVHAPLTDERVRDPQPSFLDLIAAASERVRRGREGLRNGGSSPPPGA